MLLQNSLINVMGAKSVGRRVGEKEEKDLHSNL